MALELLLKNNKSEASRCMIEADKLMKRIFQHNDDVGAISSISTGQPGSAKTAALCSMAEYVQHEYPNDKIFWRSALNAPIQIFKLNNWHIHLQKGGGIRLFNRKTEKDVTDTLIEEGKASYFTDFNELYSNSQPGYVNGVFFRDLHLKGIEKDKGTLNWFRFIRFLLHKSKYQYIFLDEYQEMVKSNSRGKLFWEIDEHADDVSTARKSLVALHANCHQGFELDYRVKSGFMILNQMYGSRRDPHSPVSKTALNAMKRPTIKHGAEGWLSEGSRYGNVRFKKIYVLPKGLDIEARIVSSMEDVNVCDYCGHKFISRYENQRYCDNKCERMAIQLEKERKKAQNLGTYPKNEGY